MRTIASLLLWFFSTTGTNKIGVHAMRSSHQQNFNKVIYVRYCG